jgi:hypothetical protein
VLANPLSEIVLKIANAVELSYTSVGPRHDSD